MYALKEVYIAYNVRPYEEFITRRRREYYQLQTVAHPFILPVVYQFPMEVTVNRYGYEMYAHMQAQVTEWVEGGTLEEYLQQRKASGKELSEDEAMSIFIKVLLATDQIHV